MKALSVIYFAAILLCTGCFDVMHYIEVKNDNSVYVDYRITVAVANKDAGSEFKQADDSRIFTSFGMDVKKLNPSIRRITNEMDSGIEITCTAPEKALTRPAEDAEYTLIPYKDNKGQYIFISRPKNAGGDSNQDAERMAQSMFASSRYRIITGGKLAAKKAVIITNDRGTITRSEPSIYRLGPLTFVDMPLMTVMFKESAVIVSASDTVDEKEIRAYFAKENNERKAAADKAEKENATPTAKDEETP